MHETEVGADDLEQEVAAVFTGRTEQYHHLDVLQYLELDACQSALQVAWVTAVPYAEEAASS